MVVRRRSSLSENAFCFLLSLLITPMTCPCEMIGTQSSDCTPVRHFKIGRFLCYISQANWLSSAGHDPDNALGDRYWLRKVFWTCPSIGWMWHEGVCGSIQQNDAKVVGVQCVTDDVRYLLDQLVDIQGVGCSQRGRMEDCQFRQLSLQGSFILLFLCNIQQDPLPVERISLLVANEICIFLDPDNRPSRLIKRYSSRKREPLRLVSSSF